MYDPVLSKLSTLKPTNATSLRYRDEMPSLLPLVIAVPRIVPEENDQLIQCIDNQWRRLPIKLAGLNESINVQYPDLFW